MAGNTKISLRIRGLETEDGHVRFNDFIKQLDIFKKALSAVDHVITDKTSTYFRVVDLKHDSPALIVLEAVPVDSQVDNPKKVVDKFFTSLDNIEQGIAPVGFDFSAYQAFKNMASLVQKNRVRDIVLSRNGDAARTVTSLPPQVDKILGPDEYEVGSVAGMLEQINVHSDQNVFHIYTTAKIRKLRCLFPKSLRQKAVASVDRYVRISGVLKYKAALRDKNPHEIAVEDIETAPEGELPTFADLRGISRSKDQTLKSEEMVRRVRNEW